MRRLQPQNSYGEGSRRLEPAVLYREEMTGRLYTRKDLMIHTAAAETFAIFAKVSTGVFARTNPP
jgi:hypothetical protein